MSAITRKLAGVLTLEPARVAIDFEGRDFTWGELGSAVAAVRDLLAGMALPPDARVGIMLRNRPAHIAALVAVLTTERCLVTLNPVLPDDKLFADIEGLNLPVIIADRTDVGRQGIRDAFATAKCAVVALSDGLEGANLLAGFEKPGKAVATAPGVAVEMLTSGTTGAPKRIPLTRAAFEASFAAFTAYERGRAFDDKPQLRTGVTMVVNPLTHIGGIYGCIGSLLNGRKIALLERFSVNSWVAAVKRNRPKVAPAVPAAVRMLLDADVDPADLSSLTSLISGTAPLPADLVDQFYERFGIPICGNYGATEFAGAVAGWTIDDFRTLWKQKRGAVGRIHRNVKARIVNPETGAELPRGEPGVLELKGDQLGTAFRFDGDDWLRTTDLAQIDEDDFLFITGRADNAIIRGGFKVHPEEVARVLGEHPAIREAAVVGIPDERLGSVPAAAAILKEGQDEPEGEALRTWLRQRLLPYQVPVQIRFVEDFPRTPSMKPSAPELKKLFDGG